MAACVQHYFPRQQSVRAKSSRSHLQKVRKLRPTARRSAEKDNTSSNSSPSSQEIVNISDDSGRLVQEEEDFEGLLPEEDWVVRGGANDSLSSNTELGRAVDNACNELEALGGLEQESLLKANELLRKLGYKGDITQPDSEK